MDPAMPLGSTNIYFYRFFLLVWSFFPENNECSIFPRNISLATGPGHWKGTWNLTVFNLITLLPTWYPASTITGSWCGSPHLCLNISREYTCSLLPWPERESPLVMQGEEGIWRSNTSWQNLWAEHFVFSPHISLPFRGTCHRLSWAVLSIGSANYCFRFASLPLSHLFSFLQDCIDSSSQLQSPSQFSFSVKVSTLLHLLAVILVKVWNYLSTCPTFMFNQKSSKTSTTISCKIIQCLGFVVIYCWDNVLYS